MSIQKINVGGQDVEIEDVSARNLINTLDDRVTTLENRPGGGGGGSEWVELTTINGEAEIKQEFSEIRMLCICDNGVNYSVTYNYDSTIFDNTPSVNAKYFMCGNPKENNYGCSFKYFVISKDKQYVCVNSCFNGGALINNYTFKAWIKPTTNKQ